MNELKSRIKTLSADDLIQLQKVYDIAYTVGSNFWLGIEEAINKVTPILELHKCSCGAILLISREFATNAQTDFDTNPQAKCWHLQSVSDSISSLNQNTKRLINQISVLLQEKKYNDAYILGSSILPVGSPTNFDYSLWKLQHAFIYQEYSSSEHKNNFYQFQYLKIFYDLFEAAERTNKIEYDKLISYINVPSYKSALWASIENGLTKRLEAINILNSEAYYRISYAFSPTKRIDHRDSTQLLKNYYQLIIDAYQAYFEIQENLETVFNLIRISMGQSFLEHPFDGLSIKGMKIFDKRGLMIEKILETVADTQLKAKLALAFDYRFRNNTSAHNDYILDLKKKIITTKTKGLKYSFSYINERLERLTSIVNALLALKELAFYERLKLPLSVMGIESLFLFFDEKTDKPQNRLTLYQYWTNAELDFKGDNFKIANFHISKDRKYLIFSPSLLITMPGATIFAPTQTNYRWLKALTNYDELIIQRFVIAPRIEYFLKAAKREYVSGIRKYFIIGSSIHKLGIYKPSLKKILKLLKHKNLPYVKNSQYNSNIPLINYKKDDLDS